MSVEFSFEELRADYRGWLKYDWADIRHQESEQARKAADALTTTDQPELKPAPLLSRENLKEVSKQRTVPLKGSIDDDVANDENMPPSQADIEKAKAVKKARREERANRTRKIKVMEVKEIRGETQTG